MGCLLVVLAGVLARVPGCTADFPPALDTPLAPRRQALVRDCAVRGDTELLMSLTKHSDAELDYKALRWGAA